MRRAHRFQSTRHGFSPLAVVVAASLLPVPVAMAEPGSPGPDDDAQGRVEPSLDALVLRPGVS